MGNEKNLLVIGITIIVMLIVLGTTGAQGLFSLPVTDTAENFSVENGTWFEKGDYLENDFKPLTENEDGFLVIEDVERGDEGVWESNLIVPIDSLHTPDKITINASNLQLTGGNQRRAYLELISIDNGDVSEEYLLDNGVNHFSFEGVEARNYVLRIRLNSEKTGETPKIESLFYEYDLITFSELNSSILYKFLFWLLVLVLVLAVGYSDF